MGKQAVKDYLSMIDPKAYHEDEQTWEEDGYTVTRTYQYSPPGCHQSCGVLFYTKDNKLEKVEGDPLSPVYQGKLCMRCVNLPEPVNDETRVKYPMRRAGERGENKWQRISWDEAYDEIEQHVREIWENDGPEAILVGLGTGRNVNWQIPFFGHAVLKTPNVANTFFTGYACYLPRVVACMGALGDFPVSDGSQGSELRYDNPEYQHPEVIVIWGCEPLISNAESFLGHWFLPAVQAGAKIISIDPALTWWGARAEYFLQLRPGTDGALGCAMLNVIISEDRYDHEFVDYWCAGMDELWEAVKDTTPEWAAEICDLDPEDIRGAARLYASGNNSTIHFGVAFDQQLNVFGTTLAMCDLLAICGNVDVPGGDLLMRGAFECNVAYAAGDPYVPPEANAKKLTTSYALHREMVDFMANASSDGIIHAIETGDPYPIKMLWIQSQNQIACMGADAPRAYDCLKKIPYIVNVDPILTPTSVAFADLILPVASGPERDSVRAWWQPLRAMKKVTSFYETKTDEEIIVDLAKRLDPELFDELGINTAEDYLNWFLHYGTGGNVESGDVESGHKITNTPTKYTHDYQYLVEEGGCEYDEWNATYRKYEKGMLREDGQLGFGTPTGRIELVPLAYKAWDVVPYPAHIEPSHGPITTPDEMKEYPLILTTGRRSWEFFHSEHRNLPLSRELHPYPLALINPGTAKEYGIEDGQWTWIENGHGRFMQRAKLSRTVKPYLVSVEHAWWYPEREGAEPSLFGVFDSNPNNCIYTFETGPGAAGAPYKQQICKIYPVKEGDITPTQQVVKFGGFGDYTPGVMAGSKAQEKAISEGAGKGEEQ